MTALLKAVPVWVWLLILLIAVLAGALIYQSLALADARQEHARYVAAVEKAAREATDAARETEQRHQRVINQVRADAADQKNKDDAVIALQRADNDSMRDETRQLMADKSALYTRLAERGKTIEDLADLLAELRSEADGYAGELAAALTESRRAGFACEASYDALSIRAR